MIRVPGPNAIRISLPNLQSSLSSQGHGSGLQVIQIRPQVRAQPCACCAKLTAGGHNSQKPTKIQILSQPGLKKMLSQIFLLPEDKIADPDVHCCYSCSAVIHEGHKWIQSLQRAIVLDSRISLLLQDIQKHNQKFKTNDQFPQKPTPFGSTASPRPMLALRITNNHSTTVTKPVNFKHKESMAAVDIPKSFGTLGSSFSKVIVTRLPNHPGPSTSTSTTATSSKLTNIKTNLANVDTNLANVDTNLANVDINLANVDTNLANVDTNMANMDTNMGNKELSLGNADEDDHNGWGLAVSDDGSDSIDSNGSESDSGTNDSSREKSSSDGSEYIDSKSEWSHSRQPVISKSGLIKPGNRRYPLFARCQFCIGKIYGINADEVRQLLIIHLREDHNGSEDGQDPIPEPPLGSIIVHDNVPKIRSTSCKFCSQSFSGMDANALKRKLEAHIHTSHQGSLQCPQCSTIVKGNSNTLDYRLKQHILLRHEFKSNHNCPICERPLGNTHQVKKHMQTHLSKEERKADEEKNSSIRESCLCPICGVVLKGSSEGYSLKGHMERIHSTTTKKLSTVKTFKCDHCDFTCKGKNTLQRHSLLHEEGAYTKFNCKKCGKGYVSGQGREYSDHILVCCDPSERPVQCPQPNCFKRFKFKQAVMLHLIGCHKKSPEEARSIIYPGLPMRNWIQNLPQFNKKRKQKIQIQNGGEQGEGQESSPASFSPGFPEATNKLLEKGDDSGSHDSPRRSVRNRNKFQRVDL